MTKRDAGGEVMTKRDAEGEVMIKRDAGGDAATERDAEGMTEREVSAERDAEGEVAEKEAPTPSTRSTRKRMLTTHSVDCGSSPLSAKVVKLLASSFKPDTECSDDFPNL